MEKQKKILIWLLPILSLTLFVDIILFVVNVFSVILFVV